MYATEKASTDLLYIPHFSWYKKKIRSNPPGLVISDHQQNNRASFGAVKNTEGVVGKLTVGKKEKVHV